MTRQFKPNPFETSPEQKAANLERVHAEREARDELRGFHGSDGVVADSISELGLKALDGGEKASQGFANAVGDLGTLAVTAPSVIREKRVAKPALDEPMLDINRTDRIPGKQEASDHMIDMSKISLRIPGK